MSGCPGSFRTAGIGRPTTRMHLLRDSHRCSPGPWGDIEYFYTFLDPPVHYLEGPVRSMETRWIFLERNREEVTRVLEAVKIDPGTLRETWWTEAQNGIIVQPPREFLETLEPSASVSLQKEILRISGDRAGLNEFMIENGDFSAFAEGLDLPEDLIRWTEARCFRPGGRTIFADTPFALSRIDDPDLQTRYLRALSRTRSMIARLLISPRSDLQRVTQWWSAGPNFLRPLPLLEAALATRGVETVDLIHLLPPNAKRVLNTFPLERDFPCTPSYPGRCAVTGR